MFCGCAEPLRRRAQHQHLPGLPRPARARCRCSTAQAVELARCALGLRPRLRGAAGRSSPEELLLSGPCPKDYQISQYDKPTTADGWRGPARRAHPPRPPRGGHRQAHPRRWRAGRIHGAEHVARRLQPRRRAARRDRHRARHPLGRAGRATGSDAAARDAAPAGRQRREDGGGLDARATPTSPSARTAPSELGTQTEIKNMNSFRFVAQGINAEVARQTALLEAGEPVAQETRHWDPVSGRTSSLRSKEEAARLPLLPGARPRPARPDARDDERPPRPRSPSWPAEREARYETDFGLPKDTAHLFAYEPTWGTTSSASRPRATVTPRRPGSGSPSCARASVPRPTRTSRRSSRLSSRRWPPSDRQDGHGRRGAHGPRQDGRDRRRPRRDRRGRGPDGDGGQRRAVPIVAKVISENADVVERIPSGGNAKAMGALVGPIMRETKAARTAASVNRLLKEQLRRLERLAGARYLGSP